MPFVPTERRDAIGIVTLSHPARRNASSRQMVEEIVAALTAFGHDHLEGLRAFRDKRKPQFRGD